MNARRPIDFEDGKPVMRHRLTLPVGKRDKRCWLVLASGPTHRGWFDVAEKTGAHVFCVNASVTMCENPSAYLSTDRRGVHGFRHFYDKLDDDCHKYIGREAVEKEVPGYKLFGLPVRTSAMWALWLALDYYRANTVHVFGVHGGRDGYWPTISTVCGRI